VQQFILNETEDSFLKVGRRLNWVSESVIPDTDNEFDCLLTQFVWLISSMNNNLQNCALLVLLHEKWCKVWNTYYAVY